MNELYLQFINRGISAGWLILAVLILRLVLKRAPKWAAVLLWGIVAVRLISPFSIESVFSLIPSSETIPVDIEWYAEPEIDSGIPVVDQLVNPVLDRSSLTPVPEFSANPLSIWTSIAAVLWLTGIGVLLLYTAVSYWRLCRKVDTAVRCRDNIFQSEKVGSPFVLGILRPRIYLPFQIREEDMEHVIAHEQAHIRRRDHWWKPLGFVLLAIYWFNPLMWLAYILLCRDIELACDEKVIKELGSEQRADYTQALLACSIRRRSIAACPLAFGEVGIRKRVKSVMNYRKPAFWVVLIAILACAAVAVCFLTNPSENRTVLMGANYTVDSVIYAASVGEEEPLEVPRQYCVTADYHLYVQQEDGEDWNYLGALSPYELTEEELYGYMPERDTRRSSYGQITDAYILRIENDNFYLVFQTGDGDTCLAYGWEDTAERGQAGSDDTRLLGLYRLSSTFYSGYVNVPFFERSLLHATGKFVRCFAHYESDDISGYHIAGFRSGESSDSNEMTDLGFAVFQTTGDGYRLIDCRVYEDAALTENGIYVCGDPAVADAGGEIRNDNSFDVILICNERVGRIERIYHAEGKEDLVQSEQLTGIDSMSLWSWSIGEEYTSMSQYFYDTEGNLLAADSEVPVPSAASCNPDTHNTQVREWFDYTDSPSDMDWGQELTIEIPELEGVVFSYIPEQIAVTDASGTDGRRVLITGMPIWNAYFYDLTGDGVPEICAALSFGSGLIDSRVVIYDYAGRASYTLQDRGNYDFTLRMNEEEDCLYVDVREYGSEERLLSGRLTFDGGFIHVEGLGAQTQDPEAVESVIAELFDTLQSSPAESSNPGDYIQEHPEAYQELIEYGEDTLRYCFGEFLKGGQTDLRGAMMTEVCIQIMASWGEALVIDALEPVTGQDWFEEFKSSAQNLSEQMTDEELERMYPVSWLLLEMMEE